jgi:threonine dehydrogenase-like Zn-dependent dehydrogenase
MPVCRKPPNLPLIVSHVSAALAMTGPKSLLAVMRDNVHNVVALFSVQREDYSFAPRHYHPGVHLCLGPSHSRAAAEFAVELIEYGRVDLAPLVTQGFSLEQYGEAIDLLEKQQVV